MTITAIANAAVHEILCDWMLEMDASVDGLGVGSVPRLFDSRNIADLLGKKVDQQPDPSNARALGNNQHAERDARQRIG